MDQPNSQEHLHFTGPYANMTMAEIMQKLQNGDKEALQYLQEYQSKLKEIEETFKLSQTGNK